LLNIFQTVAGTTHVGELVEGQIASAIWDIFDSNEANTLILVGAPSATAGGVSQAGIVFLFDATNYTLLHSIPNPEPNLGDQFGKSVGFIKNKIVVGAPLNDPSGISDAGSAYLFSPVTGQLLEKLHHDGPNDGSGHYVSSVNDGQRVVVSVYQYDGTFTEEGAIFLYDNLNTAPSADAGSVIDAFPGDTVVLDGTSSFDLDGDNLVSYFWTRTDTNGHPITFLGSTTPQPSFVILNNVPVGTVFTFNLIVNDGSLDSSSDSVDVTVITATNVPPAVSNDAVSTNEDSPIAITLSGTDDNSDPLTFSIQSNPQNGILGTIAPLTSTTASVTYTPNPDFFGSDSFNYRANDGTINSNIATVTLTVNSVNDPPVAEPDFAMTTEDTSVIISVLDNDSDVDNDPLSVGANTITVTAVGPGGSSSADVPVTIDITPPTVENVFIDSNNPNPEVGIIGNLVLITADTESGVTVPDFPDASIGGKPFDLIVVSDTTIILSRFLDGSEVSASTLPFSFDVKDAAGNTITVTEVDAMEDSGSSVTTDFVAPSINDDSTIPTSLENSDNFWWEISSFSFTSMFVEYAPAIESIFENMLSTIVPSIFATSNDSVPSVTADKMDSMEYAISDDTKFKKNKNEIKQAKDEYKQLKNNLKQINDELKEQKKQFKKQEKSYEKAQQDVDNGLITSAELAQANIEYKGASDALQTTKSSRIKQ